MDVKPSTENAKPVGDFPVDDLRAGVVRPQDMPWDTMRFPGCGTKTLLFDRKIGLATALIKMAPGAGGKDWDSAWNHVLSS